MKVWSKKNKICHGLINPTIYAHWTWYFGSLEHKKNKMCRINFGWAGLNELTVLIG